jgi:integrase
VESGLEHIAAGLVDDNGKRSRPLARSTVVRVRAVLVEILRYAVRKKWTPTNVATDARVGDVGHDARERIALTPEQVGKLWAGCDGEWFGAMFRTMVATGIRPGEAAGMHDGDVDLDGAVIEVRHGRSRDASGRSVPVDELKTDHSHRHVELSAGTIEVLRRQRAAMAAERLAAESWPDEPRLMFPDRTGRVARSEVVSADLAALCMRVDVPVVRPNELRHTAASLAVDAGVPLDQVSDQLGRKDMRMVTQTYRHKVRPTIGDGASATMNKLFFTGTD